MSRTGVRLPNNPEKGNYVADIPLQQSGRIGQDTVKPLDSEALHPHRCAARRLAGDEVDGRADTHQHGGHSVSIQQAYGDPFL